MPMLRMRFAPDGANTTMSLRASLRTAISSSANYRAVKVNIVVSRLRNLAAIDGRVVEDFVLSGLLFHFSTPDLVEALISRILSRFSPESRVYVVYWMSHIGFHVAEASGLLEMAGRGSLDVQVRITYNGAVEPQTLVGDGDGDGVGEGFGGVPAAEKAIEELVRVVYEEGESCGEEMCLICMDEFESGSEVGKMPCGHGFHDQCLVSWLGRSRLCPLCRFALPPREQ